MSECDHAIALDGIEYSLWDQDNLDCPYCEIEKLRADIKCMVEKAAAKAWQKERLALKARIEELEHLAMEVVRARSKYRNYPAVPPKCGGVMAEAPDLEIAINALSGAL